MSLKNSQTIEDLKHEYIYGSVHKDGRIVLATLSSIGSNVKQYGIILLDQIPFWLTYLS
jgi:hypothetical protein